MRTWLPLVLTVMVLIPACCMAGEAKIVLRDYLKEQWTNELLTYPITAPRGSCDANSVTLTGPQGLVPMQLSEIEYWPGSKWVKSARLSFIASLAPLATDAYLVRYGKKPVPPNPNSTDLKIVTGIDQVDITTKGFGARLLLGEKIFPAPVAADLVPAPVAAMRLADGTWFGGSSMYGPGKLKAYSATLTDRGPVFSRVAVRYTYENGNSLDLTLQVTAGDNTLRCETRAKADGPNDGFHLVLSRKLPPLRFQVQMEAYRDREQFPQWTGSHGASYKWAEIPLAGYTGPKDQPELVTQLSPWEDWWSTFTQTRIRLKLENTTREVQIRSLDPGAWVEPVPLEKSMYGTVQRTPANSLTHRWLPLLKDADGEILLRVNAAMGVRKWTISDCLSMPGAAALYTFDTYKPESTFPPDTRPVVGYRLNEVKDYVLQWNGDAGKHPRLFISKAELDAQWKNMVVVDQAAIDYNLKYTSHKSEETLPYEPKWDQPMAMAAYFLSRGDPTIVKQTLLPGRLRKALAYEIWGMQFGNAGNLSPILYDALIDSPAIPEDDRAVLRSRMAYFGYRLTDPKVWSFERGYCSGNPNMTHTWELSRGLVACTIPEHPMAKSWFRNAELIMEQTLTNSVGPSGEFTEPIGRHGRVDTLVAFAIASTRAGLHDYSKDPRLKRLMLHYVKMLTPRDARRRATPNFRYIPAWGRDGLGGIDGTVGVMAHFMRQYDPEYSAHLQWAWLEGGANARFDLLGGFETILCDRKLSSKTPAWTSEVFPLLGTVLRHGLGTDNEHQVQLYAGAGVLYPSQNGCLASIFAYGQPVAGSFAGSYEYQEGFLTCQVDLARPLGSMKERQGGFYGGTTMDTGGNWLDGPPARFGEHAGWANVSAFSALPRQDYASVDVARHHRRTIAFEFPALPEWPPVPARGEPPVDWRRQALFLKDDDPAKTAYLLLRDSVKGVKGPQPTMWQMWTVSETVDTPEKVMDTDAVLANKPGSKIIPARELKGNRFTAIGRFGVDVEYYIASPTDTPRHTLHWATEMSGPNTRLPEPEYQDLLHLQLPGDGAYFLAFYPRKRDWPAPVFTTLGNGTIIKVQGDFGTDYGFLSALETTASGEGTSFKGTAGSVQNRAGGLVLSLGAKGEVGYRQYGLTADFAVGLRIEGKILTIELPEKIIDGDKTLQPMIPFPGGMVTVTVPGTWAPAQPVKGVIHTKTATGFVLQVPAGLTTVALVRGR
ncbi:MAG: hypothetical protein ACYC7E_09495 [Armatimonadota bacterium]